MEASKLAALGFLTLFLELVLIRYLAGNIWNMGYFPNLVLLSVFVGMGVGFILHGRVSPGRSPWVFMASLFLLLILVLVVHFARPTVPGFGTLGGDVGGEVYFTASPQSSESASYVLFGFWFLSIVAIFACITQRTAKVFSQFSPLTAYTLDIAGSCAGIVTFMLLSWMRAPAWSWFVVLIPLFVFAANSRGLWRALPVVPLAIVAAVAFQQDRSLLSDPGYKGELIVRWSPYQKVEYINHPPNRVSRGIYVNGISHQAMLRADQIQQHYYQVPHTERRKAGLPPYENVLIIGAGSGNDVAAALMNGAKHVDAVEIDPVIAGLGREHHPARPWADPRVRQIVDDGRAVLTRTDKKYDLIIFALTDSLVKVSSMAQLRLENYLFTTDSLKRAYEVLSPKGDLVLYNYYRRSWLIDKYQRMMHAATEKYPLTLHKSGDFQMMLVGRERQAATAPEFTTRRTDLATDDWPFPYLRNRGIPTLYGYALGLVGLLLAVFALVLWRRGRVSTGALAGSFHTKMAFVFMGLAFLLLETKSIVQFSLLFGTTWVNSSLVFLAVLILVLAANWTATVLTGVRVLPIAFVLLIASCLATFIFPLRNLLTVESVAARFVLASILTFSPIFFANLIFSVAFRSQKVPEILFGWNLLGATLGGLAEYTSMAFGYNALALLVAASYCIVYVLMVLGRRRAASHVRATAVDAPRLSGATQ